MHLWRKLRLTQLDLVMRQDDEMLVNMINKIRLRGIDENVKNIIKSRYIDKNDPCYLGNILNIFAENGPVKRRNDNQLKQTAERLITIPEKDEVPKNFKIAEIREA